MSDSAANVNPGVMDTPRKLQMLAVLLGALLAVFLPPLLANIFCIRDGRSTNDVVVFVILPTIQAILLVGLPFVLVRKMRHLSAFDCVWLRWDRSEFIKFWLMPLGVVLSLAITAFLMHQFGLPITEDVSCEHDYTLILGWCTVFSVLAGPFAEEVFWRGYVQSTLTRLVRPAIAIVTQAALFGLIHFRPVLGSLEASLFGLIFGLWCYRRKTLLPAIVVHMAINGVACAEKWANWSELHQIRVTHDYVAEFLESSKPAPYDPNCDAFHEYARAEALVAAIPEDLEAVLKEYPSTWSDHQRETARRWVQANAEALEWVACGAKKPYYWRVYSGATGTEAAMPELRNTRTLTFALLTRMQLQALERREAEMLSDVETLYRYGQHFAGRKATVDQLVGIQIRRLALRTVRSVLTHASLSPDTLASLQSLFEDFSHDATLGMDFTLERLVWLDCIQRMFTDDGKGDGRVPEAVITGMERLPEPLASLTRRPTPEQREAFRNLDRRQTSQCVETFFQHLQIAARTPSWDWSFNSSARAAVQDRLEENAFVNLLGPPCLKAIALSWKEKTDCDALIAILAAIRYEGDCGQFPASLNDLVDAGYLSEVPRDNFSQGPLSYRRTERGFLLYSWGLDFDDDGGTPSKWGEGAAGGDQVFWPVEVEN